MSGSINRPPKGEPFVWHTRELRQSDAWRAAGWGVRRLIDFLEIEHMAHGGRMNGKLKAPRRQLAAFGISNHLITKAIQEAERLGLIECFRSGMRRANTYALTWLPLHDGTPPSNRWRAFVASTRSSPVERPESQESGTTSAPSASGTSALR